MKRTFLLTTLLTLAAALPQRVLADETVYTLISTTDATTTSNIGSEAVAPWSYDCFDAGKNKYIGFSYRTDTKGGAGWSRNTSEWNYITTAGAMHPVNALCPSIQFTAPSTGFYKVSVSYKRESFNPNQETPLYLHLRNVETMKDIMAAWYGSRRFSTPAGVAGNSENTLEAIVSIESGKKVAIEIECYSNGQRNGNAGTQLTNLTVTALEGLSTEAQTLANDAATLAAKATSFEGFSAKYLYLMSIVSAAQNALINNSGISEQQAAVTAANSLDLSLYSDFKFHDSNNADPSLSPYYVFNAAESGVVLTGSDDEQGQITARYLIGSDQQQWAFTGYNINSFRIRGKHNKSIRLANSKVQNIADANAGATYKLVPSTGSVKGWVVETEAGNNALNPSGGKFSTNYAYYGSNLTTDAGNPFVIYPLSDLSALSDESNPTLTTGRQNLNVSRSFAEGWNTVCLPFDVQVGQLKANLGNDVELYTFTGADDGNLTFTRTILSQYDNSAVAKRDNAVVMTAHTPYIIKVSEAKSSALFAQAGISSTEAGSVAQDDVTFQGTYASTDMENIYGMTSSGQILQGMSGQTIKPFRAYFTTSSDVKLQVMIDGVATGISQLDDSTISQNGQIVNGEIVKFYDLSGREVNVANLKHGVYVRNGRKFAVK